MDKTKTMLVAAMALMAGPVVWANAAHAESLTVNEAAMPVIDGARDLSARRPDAGNALDARATRFNSLISRYARSNGVPVALAHAVVRIESNYNPRARGSAGEIGLMQIKLASARGIGYGGSASALYDPAANLQWGMKYLGIAHEMARGNLCGTILRYNAGHYARRMTGLSARYCSKVRVLMAQNGA